jgi:hypothetical protein
LMPEAHLLKDKMGTATILACWSEGRGRWSFHQLPPPRQDVARYPGHAGRAIGANVLLDKALHLRGIIPFYMTLAADGTVIQEEPMGPRPVPELADLLHAVGLPLSESQNTLNNLIETGAMTIEEYYRHRYPTGTSPWGSLEDRVRSVLFRINAALPALPDTSRLFVGIKALTEGFGLRMLEASMRTALALETNILEEFIQGHGFSHVKITRGTDKADATIACARFLHRDEATAFRKYAESQGWIPQACRTLMSQWDAEIASLEHLVIEPLPLEAAT